jgi:glycosyltransferase involved in cell wall biosynthesis
VRAGARSQLPVLRTEHGVRHYQDPSCALFRHWALDQTTAIAAVSHFVGRFVEGISPASAPKIRVIHNGVDTRRFQLLPARKNSPFSIAVVSRLEPSKRIELARSGCIDTGRRIDHRRRRHARAPWKGSASDAVLQEGFISQDTNRIREV